MAVQRGATSQLTYIKEVTAGTTPATPVMLETPIVGFTPKHTNTVMESNAIRSHPYKDRIVFGRLVHAFGLDVELMGDAPHDGLVETMFGSAITAKAMAFADTLKSITLEEKVATGDFNQFTFGCFTSLAIAVSASDTAPIKMSFSGMARTGTLDAAVTLATSVTAAPFTDPYVFASATMTWAGNATPVASANITLNRAIDPLMLLGSSLPREFIAGDVTATGTCTIPYDASGFGSGTTVSGLLVGFTDVAQVYKFGDVTTTNWRQLTFPKTKITDLGRSLNARGARMQEVSWEAYYDSSTTTICNVATN